MEFKKRLDIISLLNIIDEVGAELDPYSAPDERMECIINSYEMLQNKEDTLDLLKQYKDLLLDYEENEVFKYLIEELERYAKTWYEN